MFFVVAICCSLSAVWSLVVGVWCCLLLVAVVVCWLFVCVVVCALFVVGGGGVVTHDLTN